MIIFRQELRVQGRSTVGWVCAQAAALVVFLGIYPTFMQANDALNTLVQGIGKAAGGMALRMLGMESLLNPGVLGYYCFLMMYLVFVGAVQAMLLGMSMLTRERRNKTADFLYAKPVSRLSIHLQKLGAGLALILVTNAVFLLATLGMAFGVSGGEPVPVGGLLLAALTLLWTQLFFLALGFCLAVCLPRLKSAFTPAMSTVAALFLLGMIALLLDDRTLHYLTPFRLFDAMRVLTHGGYDGLGFGVGMGATMALGCLGLALANRRDLPAL